ncbi:MAG: OmpA family protein [Methylophilaceae bacterium]
MHNDQSSYSRWSWIIALILALILLWMYLTGKGPSSACCNVAEVAAPTAEVMPMDMEEAPVVTEAFSFAATENDFTSNGDASNITWAGDDIDALKALLMGGINAKGDETSVLLTGTVSTEDIKQQKGLDAQAFFGPDATIDNQITIMMEEPTAVVAPPAAKLYFNTGVHRLPADSVNTLDPVITWLNNNPEAKAIISGFHDPTGNLARNQELAKKRAESANNALLNAGIEADRIEMRKPEVTEGGGDLSEARRVEVSIE